MKGITFAVLLVLLLTIGTIIAEAGSVLVVYLLSLAVP